MSHKGLIDMWKTYFTIYVHVQVLHQAVFPENLKFTE